MADGVVPVAASEQQLSEVEPEGDVLRGGRDGAAQAVDQRVGAHDGGTGRSPSAAAHMPQRYPGLGSCRKAVGSGSA